MVSKTLTALAVGMSGGLLALSGSISMADEVNEGLVRITDCQNRADAIQAGTAGAPCQTDGNCRGGRCGNGTGHIRGVASILLCPHGAGTHSPDHGWAPPGRVQLPYPRPVAYQKWFPDPWTGQPTPYVAAGPRPPVVYMPTDTTQLGYYYQTVPRWHAYTGMIPGPPNPADFHHDLCQLRGANGAYCPPSAGSTVQPTPAATTPSPVPADGPTPAPAPQAGALEKSSQTPALVPVNK